MVFPATGIDVRKSFNLLGPDNPLFEPKTTDPELLKPVGFHARDTACLYDEAEMHILNNLEVAGYGVIEWDTDDDGNPTHPRFYYDEHLNHNTHASALTQQYREDEPASVPNLYLQLADGRKLLTVSTPERVNKRLKSQELVALQSYSNYRREYEAMGTPTPAFSPIEIDVANPSGVIPNRLDMTGQTQAWIEDVMDISRFGTIEWEQQEDGYHYAPAFHYCDELNPETLFHADDPESLPKTIVKLAHNRGTYLSHNDTSTLLAKIEEAQKLGSDQALNVRVGYDFIEPVTFPVAQNGNLQGVIQVTVLDSCNLPDEVTPLKWVETDDNLWEATDAITGRSIGLEPMKPAYRPGSDEPLFPDSYIEAKDGAFSYLSWPSPSVLEDAILEAQEKASIRNQGVRDYIECNLPRMQEVEPQTQASYDVEVSVAEHTGLDEYNLN